MSLTSLEVSKELHELSGWKDTDEDHHEIVNHRSKWYPAYDLGYLLRKLPPVIQEDGKFLALQINAHGNGTWNMVYAEPYDKEFLGWHITRADTPEDAAAKLAIELFKQGVLTR